MPLENPINFKPESDIIWFAFHIFRKGKTIDLDKESKGDEHESRKLRIINDSSHSGATQIKCKDKRWGFFNILNFQSKVKWIKCSNNELLENDHGLGCCDSTVFSISVCILLEARNRSWTNTWRSTGLEKWFNGSNCGSRDK